MCFLRYTLVGPPSRLVCRVGFCFDGPPPSFWPGGVREPGAVPAMPGRGTEPPLFTGSLSFLEARRCSCCAGLELCAPDGDAAVTGGTCRRAAIPGIEVCGKTGTAQNPHGKDHSAFMGFAPYHEPKIAVAVYVEGGGWGATFGVPIGSLVMEKYLTGKISPERKYMEDQMLNTSIYYAAPKKK